MQQQDSHCLISATMTLMLGPAIPAAPAPPALLHVQIASLIRLPFKRG